MRSCNFDYNLGYKLKPNTFEKSVCCTHFFCAIWLWTNNDWNDDSSKSNDFNLVSNFEGQTYMFIWDKEIENFAARIEIETGNENILRKMI